MHFIPFISDLLCVSFLTIAKQSEIKGIGYIEYMFYLFLMLLLLGIIYKIIIDMRNKLYFKVEQKIE